MKNRSLLILTACLLGLSPVFAQNPEEAAVQATIDRLFEGMKKGDSSLVRSIFHSTARLQTAYMSKEGKPLLQSEAIAGFVKAVGTPHKEVWDERISGYNIRIDDNLATAWTPYEFYVDGKYLHEGVNAFQLFRSPEGWKIIQICDTRRKRK
ncbi:MAG: nuclear transport factor 2 family protein [Sphingobacteriaceae bacterium]|nr:nuclear transport factor 2 family protein [Cytophagaceae bacterium]